jgi:lipopolysaccharide export LptBFGC system permease protein LptF
MLPEEEEYLMRRRIPKILFGIVLVLAIVLSGFSICPAIEITTEKIVTDKDSYDGKEVSVKGSVSNLKFKTSKGGNNYTTFVLVGESGSRINVFIWGRLKLKPGQKVRVTGLYRKVKKVLRHNYYNEIEASEVK